MDSKSGSPEGINVSLSNSPAATSSAWSWRAELAQFLAFLRRPRRGSVRKQATIGEKLRRLLFLLVLKAVLTGLIVLPLDLLTDWAGIEEMQDYKLGFSTFLSVAILGPIIEELIFRAGLRSFTYTLIVGPVLICCTSGSYIVAIAMIFWAVVVWLVFLWQSSRSEPLVLRWQQARRFLRCYPAIFWLYVMAFGMLHTQNYVTSSWTGLLLLPLANLPQMLGGMAMGYLRLRNGLPVSMAFHMIWNAGCLTVLWLAT